MAKSENEVKAPVKKASAPAKKETKLGIDNILLGLDGLEFLGVVATNVLADGKLGLDDLAQVKVIVENFDKILNPIKNADKMIPEVKDIDADEAVVIALRVIAIYKKIKEAREAAKAC